MDYTKVKQLTHELLLALGEDPARDGLKDTPRRVADFWQSFIEYDPGRIDTVFQAQYDQMILVNGIRVYSLCEHHLLPFWCDIAIAYIPNGKVLGLSKFARIAHQAAHRLQLQERLVEEIATSVTHLTATSDVAVLAKGVHLCMEMRGVRTSGHMLTSALRGNFLEPAVRNEFYKLIELTTS